MCCNFQTARFERENVDATNAEPCVKLAVTHEEIAQMIGTSRETVSRLLADLKKAADCAVKELDAADSQQGAAESDGHH